MEKQLMPVKYKEQTGDDGELFSSPVYSDFVNDGFFMQWLSSEYVGTVAVIIKPDGTVHFANSYHIKFIL